MLAATTTATALPATVRALATSAPGGRAEGTAPGSDERWQLLLPHRERLAWIVRRRVRDPQEAEDCVQEALLRAALFAGLDEQRAAAFLTTTALRLCVDQHRRRERQQRLALRVTGTDELPGPEEIVCERAAGAWLLRKAAHSLQGRERQVMLARSAGLSTAEAARRLNISVKAAEGAFTRGRARLLGLHQGVLDAA